MGLGEVVRTKIREVVGAQLIEGTFKIISLGQTRVSGSREIS